VVSRLCILQLIESALLQIHNITILHLQVTSHKLGKAATGEMTSGDRVQPQAWKGKAKAEDQFTLPIWSPDFIKYEQPQPPSIDVRIEEEAAAQAAAQAAGYEGRRVRKFLQRRTVDYSGTYLRHGLVNPGLDVLHRLDAALTCFALSSCNQDRLQRTSYRHEQYLRPTVHAISAVRPMPDRR
jgi:hypothetical protein